MLLTLSFRSNHPSRVLAIEDQRRPCYREAIRLGVWSGGYHLYAGTEQCDDPTVPVRMYLYFRLSLALDIKSSRLVNRNSLSYHLPTTIASSAQRCSVLLCKCDKPHDNAHQWIEIPPGNGRPTVTVERFGSLCSDSITAPEEQDIQPRKDIGQSRFLSNLGFTIYHNACLHD